MLSSLISGKAGKTSSKRCQSQSWREHFQLSEDILTDMVFTRLTYLEPLTFLRILCVAFGSPEIRKGNLRLKEAGFWPNWRNATEDGIRVEPDCFFSFEDTETKRLSVFLIEVKLGDLGNPQISRQWHREWQAFLQWSKEERIEFDDAYFLALGGLGDNPMQSVERLKAEALSLGSDIPAHGASWRLLTRAVHTQELFDERDRIILEDIKATLALAGHRCVRELASVRPLPSTWRPINGFKRG